MPNEYSIQIHHYLSDQISRQVQIIDDDQLLSEDKEYARGRLEELGWIRKYLADNIDLKDFSYY